MRVLVTGGAGFIGSHLIEGLLGHGHEVRVLDSFATGRREHLAGVIADIELVEGDVQSAEHAHRAAAGCDAVVHEAALPSVARSVDDPLATNRVNVIGTLNVLLAARDGGARRVVLASSSSVYGANAVLPKTEELTPDPLSPYAVSKLAAERYCRSFTEVYGLETVVLRYFNVFGPRQDPTSEYAAAVPRFITACLGGKQPTVFGDGEQSRDFTYVDNAVAGTVLALEAQVTPGQVFNIAGGKAITVNQVVAAVGAATGCTPDPLMVDPRPGEVRHSLASIDRARHVLGYRPHVGFDAGLARTVAFFADATDAQMRAAS